MKYGLTDPQFEMISELAINSLKKLGAQVWIFGSRARGDHKQFSDIDLLYEFKSPNDMVSGQISKIKEDIEESRFPYKVDLVNAQELAESYKTGIFKDRITL